MEHENAEALRDAEDKRGDGLRDTDLLTVYYDGSCPLCDREIKFYQTKAGAENVKWHDVAPLSSLDPTLGLTRRAALERFHVQTANGELLSGAAAFSQLWLSLPDWRPLGSFTGHRMVLPLVPHSAT